MMQSLSGGRSQKIDGRVRLVPAKNSGVLAFEDCRRDEEVLEFVSYPFGQRHRRRRPGLATRLDRQRQHAIVARPTAAIRTILFDPDEPERAAWNHDGGK